MGYFYEEEKKFRDVMEKLILYSDRIDNVYGLYEEVYGKEYGDGESGREIEELAEKISLFFENVKEKYNYCLLEMDTDTLIYKVDDHYKNDMMNLTKVIEQITADDFEKMCALFLKEIVKCESVNATQRSHDQGIDFVGYKKYIRCLTTEEQNKNLLYVIGQAKHYKDTCVDTKEIRELAGAVYLLRTNDFAKKRNGKSEKVIYSNLNIDAFTPIVPCFITSNYFSDYAYVLCRNAAIIAIDRLSLILNFLFSNKFNAMSQKEIMEEIQSIERIK